MWLCLGCDSCDPLIIPILTIGTVDAPSFQSCDSHSISFLITVNVDAVVFYNSDAHIVPVHRHCTCATVLQLRSTHYHLRSDHRDCRCPIFLRLRRTHHLSSEHRTWHLRYGCTAAMAKAKVHVYSDSVLCLGKVRDHSEANEKLKSQITEFPQSNEFAELSGLSSIGIFAHDSHRLRFSERSTKIWKLDK